MTKLDISREGVDRSVGRDRLIYVSVAVWLVLLAVLLLLALTAGTALAKKPVPPPEPPNGMCGMVVHYLADGADLIVPCIDVSSEVATAWAFDFEITGPRLAQVSSVVLNIRERDPGDFCWQWWGDPRALDADPSADVVAFTVRTDEDGVPMNAAEGGIIPASDPEACLAGNMEDSTDSMVATLGVTGPTKRVDVKVTVRPVREGE